ncbi:MAG: hypothetical protein Q4B28_03850 [bacterium]|nr:hypothetical protein [bacterium]
MGKKPLKLDISRNNEIVKDLKEHVLGDKILKAFKKQTTPEESVKTLDTPEKIAGTVLENIEITTAKNRIPL